jgi:polyhydroxyalkanoate depolymerase
MIYQMYQAQSDMMAPFRALADLGKSALEAMRGGPYDGYMLRSAGAAYEMISRAGLSHSRPPFGIETVRVGDEIVAVTEESADVTPFATLLHFKKAGDTALPRALVVAPLSGHFATLLRGTVATMLPDHDVYLTDWHNARDVSLEHGRFGVDEYIDHIIRFLEKIGPGAHVVAVCQPCVPVLAAVASMAEGKNDAVPSSMTLMAGPIDSRLNPTKVNELAESKPIEWFERTLIDRVPWRFPGAHRRVYPGFLQLAAFMNMNLDRHIKAHRDLFYSLADGNEEKAQLTRTFYDEYFAVLDMPAEFYLETVAQIFQQHDLARGVFNYRGRRIDPRAITHTALLTVEGERDDVCGLGQTLAAQELCSGLRPYRKRHHLQAGVGHYGVFSGTRWNNQVYPVLKNMVLASD